MTPVPFLAGAAFAYATVAAFFSGLRLLRTRTFLPFHQQAAGSAWADIPPRTQLLLLALMRVAGLGSSSIGLSSLVISARSVLRLSDRACLVLGAGVVAYWAGMFGVTYFVHRRTGAATPYRACCSVASVALLGWIGLLTQTGGRWP